MTTTRRVAAGLVACVALTGCGGGDEAGTVADEATSPAAAAATDAGGDTEVGAIDREAEGGERPEGLPEDVPVPAGLRSVLSMGSDGNRLGFSGSISGTDPATAADGLEAALEDSSWTVTRRESGEGQAVGLDAERGDEHYTATFTGLGQIVSVQLTYGTG